MTPKALLPIKAIFFDFDGVILDSVKVKTDAFAELYRPFGEQIVSKVIQYHQQHGGISRHVKIKHFHEQFLGTPLDDTQLESWATKFSEIVVDQVVASPWIVGARELLDWYRGQGLMFIVSGTPETELREIVERIKITYYFNEIKGSPVKKPEHINALLKAYQLNAQQCCFLGDALTDYHAAKDTGCHFIGIQGDIDFPENAFVLEDCRKVPDIITQFT